MMSKWMLPVLVAAVAGVIGFRMTRHAIGEADAPALDRLRDVTFLTRTLRLNDDQAREIESMHAEFGARLKDCCDGHCAVRKRLGRSLIDDDWDADRIDAFVHELCNAYAKSERLALEHIQRVRDLLDSEQRRRFDELVIDALLCSDCPVCGTETRNPSRETIHGGGSHADATLPAILLMGPRRGRCAGSAGVPPAFRPENASFDGRDARAPSDACAKMRIAAMLQRGVENDEARLEPGAPTGNARIQPKREHS